jgi:hypothetical protein
MLKRLVPALICAAVGCGEYAYVYQPTAQATATTDGFPAASYNVPRELPRGDVNVASFGLTDMQLVEGGPKERFLQVRLTVANNNDVGPWTIDTREQLLSLTGEGQSPPSFANSDAAGLPQITIAPAQKHTIDLYYALPFGVRKSRDVPQFDLLWRVHTPTRAVAERTPFERIEIDNNAYWASYGYGYPGFGYSLGFGPSWWYDPFFYPAVSFHHPVIIHQRYPGFVHTQTLPPRRVYGPVPGRAYVVPPGRVQATRPVRHF